MTNADAVSLVLRHFNLPADQFLIDCQKNKSLLYRKAARSYQAIANSLNYEERMEAAHG